MRDSFGGVFTLNLFLVFIVIYVAFTAVSLNYAKAFRVKNSVIDFIETNEIIDFSSYKFKEKLQELDEILKSSNYHYACNEGNGPIKESEKVIGYCYNGVVIEQKNVINISGTDSQIIEYKVKTYADWNVSTLNKILVLGGQKENSQPYVSGVWAIEGEAKVVYKPITTES